MIHHQATGVEILQQCQIHCHAPVSAATTGLPDGAVDVAYSNTVLEHVPLSEIARIFAETYRILRPGGHMAHLIDLSDHFSHSDHSISTINFLQFSDESFARYNSRFIFQNRLRASAWRQLIVEHGFEIVYWQTSVNDRARRELSSLQLNEAFTNLSAEELCTSSICVVAKRP
jgi:ubiquinone/menaquinone biosynthesis C-methylase UbiE